MQVPPLLLCLGVSADSLLCIACGQPLQPCTSFSTKGLTYSLFCTTVQSLIKKGKTSAYTADDTDVESSIKSKHWKFHEAEATIYAVISCVQ